MAAFRSLRHRATLVMSALLFAAISAYAIVSYREIAQSAVDSAHDRLHSVSSEFGALLASSADQMKEEIDSVAAEPRVVDGLRDGSEAAARAILHDVREGNSNSVYAGVFDPEGRLLAATIAPAPHLPAASELSELTTGDSAVVGELRAAGDTIVYPVIAAVRDGDATLGYLVRWRRLSLNGGGRERLEELIGSGARMYLTNASGDLWTDFARPVEAPGVELSDLERGVEYTRAAGEDVLALARPIPGTPWAVLIEFPRAAVASGANAIIRNLLAFGLGILVLGAVLAWITAGRFTAAIEKLAAAARDLTAGAYGRRVDVHGDDEVGTLAKAFNTMSESVAGSHEALELKVQELARLEARHRETSERLEHLISSSRTIMYELDLSGTEPRIAWISANVQRLLGHTVEEALVPGWWVANVHPENRHLAAEALQRFGREPEITLEYRFRCTDGEYRLIRDEQRVLRDGSGEPVQVVGTMSDITEARRLETERNAAEAASQAKSEFLSRMSHELRTPMNSILGFAQLLRLDMDEDDDVESVDHILRGGRHLLQLIDEVLDIARIEAGRMSMSLEPVAVGDVLGESVDLVRTMAEDRDIELEVDTCELFVRADRQRLKQVLLNLLSNAIKYNRAGGRVRVGCERAGERLRVFVADTGRGITREEIGRMFMPFERLDADQAGIDGTGLGLSLSKGFAEAMGGELGVESQPGVGSRFWVELEIATEQVSTLPPSVREGMRTAGDGALRNVLYIEDNASNFHLVERLLRMYRNVRVIPAMQGRLGLQLARQHRPDLVLLDVHLPDMKGDEVLAELQADEHLCDVPVIVISADATPKQFERLIAGGAREYLTKPFDVRRLMEAIDDALAARAG